MLDPLTTKWLLVGVLLLALLGVGWWQVRSLRAMRESAPDAVGPLSADASAGPAEEQLP